MQLRRLAGVVAAAAVVPLAGCSVVGDVHVHPDDTLDVDLDVAYVAASDMGWLNPCSPTLAPGLAVESLESDPGEVRCSIEGTTHASALAQGELSFLLMGDSSADHVFLRLPPGSGWGPQPLVRELDVTLHFPGEVVAATGGVRVDGRTATVTDPKALLGEGATITARKHAGWPGWLVPGLAGVAWGGALAAGTRWARGGASGLEPTTEPAEPAGPTTQPPPPAAEATRPPTEDPTVWATDG